jgi:dUTP pyrophosphatase
MQTLRIHRVHPDVHLPYFATEQSACFDIQYCRAGKFVYNGYSSNNRPFERYFTNDSVTLMPFDRVMVPTGLILDIPKGYSVRVHPRSGLAYKQGLSLPNAEGVIDSDYVQELFVLMINNTNNQLVLNQYDRVAQGELVIQQEYTIVEVGDAPGQKTNRIGGIGSTGVEHKTFVYPVSTNVEQKRRAGRPKGSPNKVKGSTVFVD